MLANTSGIIADRRGSEQNEISLGKAAVTAVSDKALVPLTRIAASGRVPRLEQRGISPIVL